jgi:hypothetical protein
VREDLPPWKTAASLTYHSSANTTTSTTATMTATQSSLRTDSFRTEKRRKWRLAENGLTERRWIKQMEEKKRWIKQEWGKEEGSGGEEGSGLEEPQEYLKQLYYAIGLFFRYTEILLTRSLSRFVVLLLTGI